MHMYMHMHMHMHMHMYMYMYMYMHMHMHMHVYIYIYIYIRCVYTYLVYTQLRSCISWVLPPGRASRGPSALRARLLAQAAELGVLEGAGDLVISTVILRVAPFRALITLLITYLLSPLPLQVRMARLGPVASSGGCRNCRPRLYAPKYSKP